MLLPATLALLTGAPSASHGGCLPIVLDLNATYRYVNASSATNVGPVPSDWYTPAFDDSAWFVGTGRFGTSFGGNLPNASGPDAPCTPASVGSTPWDTNWDPYLRTSFQLDVPRPLTMWIAVDNGVERIFINGVASDAFFNAEGAAFRWEHVLDIPSFLLVPGENTVALQIEDHGFATGFEMVITEMSAAQNDPFLVGGGNVGTRYCEGSNCPCGNDSTIGGCVSTRGRGAIATALGSPSVSADDLIIEVSDVRPGFAYLYVGMTQACTPIGDGLLALTPGPYSPDLVRYPVISIPKTSVLEVGPDLLTPLTSHPVLGSAIAPGQTLYFQCVYRDAPNSPCGTRFNTTNGVAVTLTP